MYGRAECIQWWEPAHIERSTVYLSAIRAMCGSSSLTSKSGWEVSIGLNRGRTTSFLESGFKSNMSICDGPPYIHTSSTCLAFVGRAAPARARARNSSGTVRPKNVAPPIRNTSRRLYWWYARQPGFMGSSFCLCGEVAELVRVPSPNALFVPNSHEFGYVSMNNPRLVVHLKFAGVYEAPEYLFQSVSQRVRRLEVLQARLRFLGTGEATQRPQEQLFQPLLVGQPVVAGQLGHAAAVSGDLAAHLLVVGQEQQLRQRHVVPLFAVTLH